MNWFKTRRRLSNVHLTRRYRLAYMGLWVAVTMLLVVAMNAVLYLYIEERWGAVGTLSNAYYQQYVAIRTWFVFALAIETAVFGFGIFGLAATTTHRVAGPYFRLKAVFKEVENGNYQQGLSFRKYDKLEDVAEAFNAMMETVRRDLGVESQPVEEPEEEAEPPCDPPGPEGDADM